MRGYAYLDYTSADLGHVARGKLARNAEARFDLLHGGGVGYCHGEAVPT